MGSMRPSGVCRRISREHDALRQKLDELREIASALTAGSEPTVDRALTLARSIWADLHDHLELEDAILLPALRECDAWGAVRAEQLVRHHTEQRAAFSQHSLAGLSTELPATVARFLHAVIDDLMADMAHEERDVLGVLRDDVLGVDVEDG
jgi:hypothetical protein